MSSPLLLLSSKVSLGRRVLAFAAVAALLAGCGGGGGESGPATGGTGSAQKGSFASGPITGFGSVIVNGVRFDDSTAVVTDEDGNASSRDALRLGMSAEVHGGAISSDSGGPRATADGIVFGAAVVGPVSAVDATARTLVVLGQTVRVLDLTVIDDRLVGGFPSIAVGSLLEVHGTLDATTGVVTATRLEPTLARAGYRVRGVVAGLDTTARTFSIGAASISYAGVSPAPDGLANGALVRVRLLTAQVGGVWIATRVGPGRPHVDDANEAELRGSITAFTSTAAFSVNGIPVDASGATFPDGTAGIVLGAAVKVEGSSSNGTVVARRVSIENERERHDEGFELHGSIAAIDTTAKTFVLRGVTVAYGGPGVEFRRGTVDQLAVGVKVEVKGVLSADRTTLQATRISFGD